MDDLTARSIILSCEVENLLAHDVAAMVGESQLNSHIKEVKNVRREFRWVNTQLKVLLGDGFTQHYPVYEGMLKSLRDQERGAWARLDELEKQENHAQREEEFQKARKLREEELRMKNAQQRAQLLSNRTLLVDQINRDIVGCDFEKMSTADEVYQKLDGFGSQLDTFQFHCGDLDVCYGQDDHGFKDENRSLVDRVRKLLTQGNEKVHQIYVENQPVEHEEFQRRLKHGNVGTLCKLQIDNHGSMIENSSPNDQAIPSFLNDKIECSDGDSAGVGGG